MRLDRGLRGTALRPYPTGYEAPSTDDINRDKPNCVIGGINDPGKWLGDDDSPAIIGLSVRLIPLWADNQGLTAKMDEDVPCLIYKPMSAYEKVRVEVLGDGFYQKISGDERIAFINSHFLNYELELPSPCLYQKVFLTQAQRKNIHWNSHSRPREDVPFLWAYGGQQVGDDIHPCVFTLESIRQETHLQLSSLLFWKDRGLNPVSTGQGQDTAFQDVFELDQTRSFKESLEAGMSVIHLNMGQDESGQILKVPYVSYRFANNVILYRKGG